MHNLIVGASYSGKSWLAKRFAATAEAQGHNVLVFDPLKSTGWPASAKKYAEPDQFIKAFWATENVHVFIDEARVLFEAERNEAERIAYQGRHGGRLVYFIGQRAMSMIPPNARDQCGKVFAFKQSRKDSVTLAEEFDERLLECQRLPKTTLLMSDGFVTHKAALDFTGGYPPKITGVK